MKPVRIQLRRTRGWRKPPGAVVVSRPSKWGNPFAISSYKYDGHFDEADARAKAIRDFEAALTLGGILPLTEADVQRELRGKTLACWCPLSKKCHADVLLEVANR